MSVKQNYWVAGIVMAVALVGNPASHVFAGPSLTQNTATVTITPQAGGSTFDQTLNGTTILDLSHTSVGGASSTGTGLSHVEYGGIMLQGAAIGTIDVVTKGVFRDNFTISSPNVAKGTPGTFTFFVEVDGSMDAAGGDTLTSWDLQAGVASLALDSIAHGSQGSPDSLKHGLLGDPLGSSYSRTVSFLFGEQTSLDIELTASIAARLNATNDPGGGSFDFSPYVFWDGISAVRVAAQPLQNVAEVQLDSTSGTNWLDSFTVPDEVPEPASGLMMLAGLITVLGRRER